MKQYNPKRVGIQKAEELVSGRSVYQLIDARQREVILGRRFVEVLVIHTYAPFTSGFAYEDYVGDPSWVLGFPEEPNCSAFDDVISDHGLSFLVDGSPPLLNWWDPWVQSEAMYHYFRRNTRKLVVGPREHVQVG